MMLRFAFRFCFVVSVVVLIGCSSAPSKNVRAGVVGVEYTRSLPDQSYVKNLPQEVRLISRASTGKSVAMQVGVNVLSLALGGEVGGQGFSKNELRGEVISDVDDRDNVRNPVATRFVSRVKDVVNESVATNPEWKSKVFVNPILVGGGSAALVYESLLGDDELFRLKLFLEVYKRKEARGFSFSGPYEVVDCSTETESPRVLSEWSSNDYVLVKSELASQLDRCQGMVIAQLDRLLAN